MKELLVKFNILMARSDQAECGTEADRLLLQSLETLKELCDSNIKEHKDDDKLVMTFMLLKEKCMNTIIDRNFQLQKSIENHIEILEKAEKVKLELDAVRQQQQEVIH